MISNLTVRAYDAETDFETVAGWYSAHTGRAIHNDCLPPTGVVVASVETPLAACWIYLAVGVGVAFLEHAVTRPLLLLDEAVEVMALAVGALEEIARTHDYSVIIANTYPAVARVLGGMGYKGGGEQLVQVAKQLD